MPRAIVFAVAAVLAVAIGPLSPVVHGQTKKPDAQLLATPAAELIKEEFLAPAVRQAVANGVATLMARMTAEGNEHGLAFPPNQTMIVIAMEKVPAKRVKVEEAVYEHEYADVERLVPVIESGQPTGRFRREMQKTIVKSKKVGTTTVERLRPAKDGTETIDQPKYGPGGPAAWGVNVPGLNGMALYVLAKAGLGKHPATVKHAAALAEHASEDMGLPDSTFDVAWMAAGFAALGPDSPHEQLARRLIEKLLDGQIRQKGDVEGLWGPVCVNYGYFGKLVSLGQTVRQELDVNLPKKMEAASPAEQKKLVAMGKDMAAFNDKYEKTRRDVFRAGMRMLGIQSSYSFENRAMLPGLPFNAYQWVFSDVESTEAATFAIAAAKQAGLLPKETDRLMIKGKNIHPPVKTDGVVKAAARRLAEAIDDDGGASALAFSAANKGFEKTDFPAASFASPEATMPTMFNMETACTSVAAQDSLESLVAADGSLDKQLAEPRKRARDRAARIAARWYKESATPATAAWQGMYPAMKVSHADLKKSVVLELPASSDTAVESLPWGSAGCLYRIVPGFRGLFAGAEAKPRFDDDLFRQLAYRLVALQDQNGQWSTAGILFFSTATESLSIGRTAEHWHKSLNRDPPVNINLPDPANYAMMLHPHGWCTSGASGIDAAAFPTLASLLFLLESIDRPVSLDGIPILPEPSTEPAKEADAGKPPARLSPVEAARRVVRPNVPRQELFDAIVGTWSRNKAAAEAAPAKPEEKPSAEREKKAEKKEQKADEEDDGLGKFEDLLESADEKE